MESIARWGNLAYRNVVGLFGSNRYGVIPFLKVYIALFNRTILQARYCRMRHWFGRFKRKSIIVSKSVEMVNVTVALFARFRVNGDVFDILKIGQIEPNIII